MLLAPGFRLGPYEIVSVLGAGGMGQVYRARETRLERVVALKILPEEFRQRTDRQRRFQSEARLISALSHPHICALFDVGEQDGASFLVMEYLEGETLEDRLTRGPLSGDEVLRYATQIADALDHAHQADITHRDLKPSNVILTATGVKLLDFGLARGPALHVAHPSATQSLPPERLTEEGTLVGTFHYMAPEQLEGKEADHRTDIFAFGTVLFEMATGRKPFEGASQAGMIASILTARPPAISSVRSADALPAAIDHIVERCLAKHPDDRWQTARDVTLELGWIAKGGTKEGALSPAPAARATAMHRRERLAWTLAITAIVAAGTVIFLPRRSAPPEITRFVVPSPPGTSIGVAENRTRVALSPDGRRVAMIASAGGASRLWVRALDAVEVKPLAGTEGAQSPFWSPDSRLIGFFSPGDGLLKKVDASGGPVLTIGAAQADGGAVWGRDGTILFTQFLDGIYRVAAAGGTPVRVTRVDKAGRELNHYWPEFLPDGRHFLYMATRLEASGVRATPAVYVASLDAAGTTLVAQRHSRMVYMPPGRLLFVEEGALLAQRFDVSTLQLVGEPVQIADGVAYFRSLGNGAFSVSTNGVLAYQGAADTAQIMSFDRRGTSTDIGWSRQNYTALRFSPDGRSIAVAVVDPRTGGADIWIYDATRGAPVRLTSDPSDESDPVWSADGRRMLIRMLRGGPESLRIGSAAPNLYAKAIASGAEELLVSDPGPLQPDDWSKDGRWIAYTRNTRQTGTDVWLMPASGAPPQPFSDERFEEYGATFSPDSQWIAFVSTESGSAEVYVARLDERGKRTRISVDGGTTPRWSADGRELFYMSSDNRAIMAVSVQPGAVFTPQAPRRLFSIGPTPATRARARNAVYDVSPDGERFLVSIPTGDQASSHITLVLNWTAGLP